MNLKVSVGACACGEWSQKYTQALKLNTKSINTDIAVPFSVILKRNRDYDAHIINAKTNLRCAICTDFEGEGAAKLRAP